MTEHDMSGTAVRRRRALAVAGATAAAILVWVVARATGAELEMVSGGQTVQVGLPVVAAAALAASLAGWGLLALLERRGGGRARQTWTAAAVVVLLISLVGPLAGEAETSTRVYLELMHVAVGAVLIPGLRAGSAREHDPGAGARDVTGRPV